MVGFSLVFDGIHSALERTKARVRTFVPDEQKEFGRGMKRWFEALRRWTGRTAATAFIGRPSEDQSHSRRLPARHLQAAGTRRRVPASTWRSA
jgi:hypothetical protein